MGKKLKAY